MTRVRWKSSFANENPEWGMNYSKWKWLWEWSWGISVCPAARPHDPSPLAPLHGVVRDSNISRKHHRDLFCQLALSRSQDFHQYRPTGFLLVKLEALRLRKFRRVFKLYTRNEAHKQYSLLDTIVDYIRIWDLQEKIYEQVKETFYPSRHAFGGLTHV